MPRKRHDDEEDDISDLGEDETGGAGANETPRFKYSTADMAQDGNRNTKCCLIAVCLFFVAVAIVVSILLARLGGSDDTATKPVNTPTPAPVVGGPTAPPGTNQFQAQSRFVQTSCSDSPDRCSRTCEGFDCCDPLIASNQGCFFNNMEGCLNYARCHIQDQQFDAASDLLPTLCSLPKIADNRQPCQDLCSSVECCWDTQNTDSCLGSNFYTCVDFGLCQNLRSDLRVPVPDQPKLDEVCNPKSTAYDKDDCAGRCQKADCCKPSADTCILTDLITCLMYEPSCENVDLPHSGDIVQVPETPIREVCSSIKLQTDPVPCQQACEAAACCRNSTCVDTDPLGCLHYEKCNYIDL